MQTTPDRRTTRRVPLSTEALIYANGQRFACQTIDVSPLGVALRGRVSAEPGALLRITFTLGDESRRIHATGILVRDDRDPAGVGVRFQALDAPVKRWIEDYVTAGGNVTSAISPAESSSGLRAAAPKVHARPEAQPVRRRPPSADPELLALYREALDELSAKGKRRK